VLEIVQREGIKHAILKDKSPSCGVYCVYDGSFKGRLRKGRGVTSALLYRHGVTLFSEDEVWESISWSYFQLTIVDNIYKFI